MSIRSATSESPPVEDVNSTESSARRLLPLALVLAVTSALSLSAGCTTAAANEPLIGVGATCGSIILDTNEECDTAIASGS